MGMLITDVREVKKMLEIPDDDKSEDVKLNYLIEHATSIIEEYLDRPGLSYSARTEYYDGNGTQFLLLRSRPVFVSPTIQVWVDEEGNYGSTSGAFTQSSAALTYGDDFSLKIDQDNGTSRSAILIRLNGYWNNRQVRQAGWLSPFVEKGRGNIKITYTAGYTTDTLPAAFRAACDLLVARMRYILPLGMELSSESYEDRSISILGERKGYLMSLVKPLLFSYKNWKF